MLAASLIYSYRVYSARGLNLTLRGVKATAAKASRGLRGKEQVWRGRRGHVIG